MQLTHTITVSQSEFEQLKGHKRHAIVKDSTKFATGDTAIVEPADEKDKPASREQLTFTITDVEHGPGSKHINGHYCLLGLYAPYAVQDDIPATVGGGAKLFEHEKPTS